VIAITVPRPLKLRNFAKLLKKVRKSAQKFQKWQKRPFSFTTPSKMSFWGRFGPNSQNAQKCAFFSVFADARFRRSKISKISEVIGRVILEGAMKDREQKCSKLFFRDQKRSFWGRLKAGAEIAESSGF